MVINTFELADQSNATLSNAIVEEMFCCSRTKPCLCPWDKEVKKSC